MFEPLALVGHRNPRLTALAIMTATAVNYRSRESHPFAAHPMSKSLSWLEHEIPPEAEPKPLPSGGSAAPGAEQEAAGPLDFAQVYEQYFDFVWRFAAHRGVPRPALDDVTQEVFLIVHRQLQSFEGRSTLRTWIAGITFNFVRGYLRKRSNWNDEDPLDAVAQMASLEPLPLEVLEQKSAADLLATILAKMTEIQREAFILCEVEGMAATEAAQALGINENTMRARLRDARLVFEALTARLRLQQAWSLR